MFSLDDRSNFLPSGSDLSYEFSSFMLFGNRWKKIRGGNIVRNPILGFGDGIHIKLSRKA